MKEKLKENETYIHRMVAHERRLSTNASRTMAAMSLGFIVMVTPWTIQEVVVACTGTKMPDFLDFIVTWMALSNSFWNPFLYWLLNNNFRRISKELFLTKVLCRGKKSPTQCCTVPTPLSRDLEEKYWGEILERAVSTSSLGKCPPPPPPPRAK
ncbi:muscarinic acetylcholine receptor M5 isoform X2 [Halyomorpha halys]|uniref:muscarinic acetylcholine receptor M5 isoform X2 n=1 Tax=Halyomorpha halys TaxID=286706 RepID=UPI0006D4F1F8|nr:octopamine receptor-like isoform X2 [Halyomorpha halys]